MQKEKGQEARLLNGRHYDTVRHSCSRYSHHNDVPFDQRLMISKHLVPPGGWKFQHSPTLVIRGESWEDLVRKVVVHRLSNRIPVGDVEGEIEAQLSELHPSIVMGAR